MTVRCAHCGEELLGAVNRCWKCGRQFVARPTVEGLPPVRVEPAALAAAAATSSSATTTAAPTAPSSAEPLEARVLDDSAGDVAAATLSPPRPLEVSTVPPPPSIFQPPAHPLATPLPTPAPRRMPQRPNFAAQGGAYGAIVLGVFALVLAPFRWEGAIVALVGLVMGIWGVYSPRRSWALVGMLLCTVALGWGTFTGVRQLYLYLNRYAPVSVDEPLEDESLTP
jgi:hypothetical protein